MRVQLKRIDEGYNFEATNEDGKSTYFDTTHKNGDKALVPGPMQHLLMAMGGCAGIDVVMILDKQKQEIQDFEMIIDGEREAGKEPSLWKKAHIHFKLKGKIESEKAERAAKLSIEKYCSVAETLRRAGAEITFSVEVTA